MSPRRWRRRRVPRHHMPDLPITLYTERSVACPHLDEVVRFEADGYLARIPRLASSPYERTLFLDSDTYVCGGPLTGAFDLLDEFDIALAHAPLRAIPEVAGVPDAFPEYNAGVILFADRRKFRPVWRTGQGNSPSSRSRSAAGKFGGGARRTGGSTATTKAHCGRRCTEATCGSQRCRRSTTVASRFPVLSTARSGSCTDGVSLSRRSRPRSTRPGRAAATRSAPAGSG